MKPGEEASVRKGHCSVFRDQVANPPDSLTPGEEADVVDGRGGYLGRGLLSGGGRVICRLYTRRREPLDRDFFHKRLQAAHTFRRGLNLPNKSTNGYRAVFAEGDRLPGLMVDRYGDHLVIQTPTAGLEQRKELLVDSLTEIFRPLAICERNDSALRKREGLPEVNGWIGNAPTQPIIVSENGIQYQVDPLGAMKTGHFFDQRENRLLLERISRDKSVLEMFCYTGGFGLSAAKYGAKSVLSVDGAAPAIEAARENARLNGLQQQIEYEVGDGFEVLHTLARGPRRFDVIVIDPPAFAKTTAHVEKATRAYQDLNQTALRMLPVGGYLLTCSCSQQITRRIFRKLVADAAGEARRIVRVVAEGGAGKDHPVLLNVPETDYLKSLLLCVVEKF